MNILIASDSFKESMSSSEVAKTIEKAFTDVSNQFLCKSLLIGDGGEGTVAALTSGTNGQIITLEVNGPLGNRIKSFYGISNDKKTAFIEMAAASGLELLDSMERNPLKTSTYGTGELILDAINRNVETIIIGLGGSATNDGGAGMARALGAKFFDKNGLMLDGTGGSLSEIFRIDMSDLNENIQNVKFIIASDVNNPLLGPMGATEVFSRQKGADENMVKILESGLANYANIIKKITDRDIITVPGSGAAGGLGAGLLIFTNAKFQSGIDVVLDMIDFDSHLKDVNLVITGEGKIDSQTIQGKAPIGIAMRAYKKNIPVIAFCGITGENFEEVYEYGISAIFPIINRKSTIDILLAKGKENLYQTAYSVAKTLLIGVKK